MNKAYRRPIISILIGIIFLIFIGISCHKKVKISSVRDFREIMDNNGTLNIVTDYNPIGYYVLNDTIAGFNYELLNLLQKTIPLKIHISLESDILKSIDRLENGKYDIIIRNVPITSNLRTKLNFTQPILYNKEVLVQRKKEYNHNIDPIRKTINLAKKIVYIPKGSPVKLRIQNLSREIGDTIYIHEDDRYADEQLIMMVASGNIDFMVCDEDIAKNIAKVFPEIDCQTPIGFTHLEGWAVRKNNPELLDSLNVWLNKLKRTKQFKRIYNKYYK